MNDQPVTIRFANVQDAEMIADISRSTFYDTFAASNTPENMEIFLAEQFTKDSLMAEVKLTSNIFLLAYCGDELVGYVKLRKLLKPVELAGTTALEIARIYVLKDHFGKGIGNTMMKYIVDLAKEMNNEVIWLAVWENNQRAISFYRKWGFTVFDEQIFVLGNDLQNDWIMKKVL